MAYSNTTRDGRPGDLNVTRFQNLHVLNDLEIGGHIIGGGSLPLIHGTWFFVDPTDGAATNDGLTPDTAFANISTAYTACTDGRGDGIVLLSRGTTTTATTSYLTAAITWSKSGITVVGISAPVASHQRSRITNASTALALTSILTISGSNNTFVNLSITNNGTSAGADNAVTVSGNRNAFINCHIATLVAEGAAADQYSLTVTGSENAFYGGTIGTDTVNRGNFASADLHLSGAVARNRFFGTEFLSFSTGGTAHGAVKATTTTGGRSTMFKGCTFINFGITAQAAIVIQSGANDRIYFSGGCDSFGFTANGPAGLVYVSSAAPAASGAGGLATTV